MLTVNEACEKALSYFPTIGMKKKIVAVCDMNNKWIITGRYFDDDCVEYGNNPISIDKITGEIEVFSMAENFEQYYNDAVPVQFPLEFA